MNEIKLTVLSQSKADLHTDKQKWVEYTPELWEPDRLEHLRRNAIPFDYVYKEDLSLDLDIGVYGFRQGSPVVGDKFLFIDEGNPQDRIATQPSPIPASDLSGSITQALDYKGTIESILQEASICDLCLYNLTKLKWSLQVSTWIQSKSNAHMENIHTIYAKREECVHTYM